MYKQLLLITLLSFSIGNVQLSFGEYDYSSNSLPVNYTSDSEIYGFQFASTLNSNVLNLEDAIDIRQVKNLKLANQMLKQKRKQKQKQMQEAQQANIKAQANANAEASERQAQAEMQKQQALTASNVQYEQAKNQMEIQRLQTQSQLDMQKMQMLSLSKQDLEYSSQYLQKPLFQLELQRLQTHLPSTGEYQPALSLELKGQLPNNLH